MSPWSAASSARRKRSDRVRSRRPIVGPSGRIVALRYAATEKSGSGKVLVGPELSLLDPRSDCNASGLCDLKLHRSFGLALHYHRPRQYLIAVSYVADMKVDKIAASKFAVDRKIEER